jgi:undecaprenyl-diphosphatase
VTTVLTKDSTHSNQPELTVLGCAATVLLTVALLVHWQITDGFDRAVLNLLGSTSGSPAAHVATAITTLGDAVPLLTILIFLGVVVPVRWGGGWRVLALPSISTAVAFAAATGIKNLTERARPPESGWAGTATGFAFPSGHAASATAGYMVLAVLVSALMPTARQRGFVLGAGVCVSLLIGVSRVVLGVHWPTDVLAGWALGTTVAAATLLATRSTTGGPR